MTLDTARQSYSISGGFFLLHSPRKPFQTFSSLQKSPSPAPPLRADNVPLPTASPASPPTRSLSPHRRSWDNERPQSSLVHFPCSRASPSLVPSRSLSPSTRGSVLYPPVLKIHPPSAPPRFPSAPFIGKRRRSCVSLLPFLSSRQLCNPPLAVLPSAPSKPLSCQIQKAFLFFVSWWPVKGVCPR